VSRNVHRNKQHKKHNRAAKKGYAPTRCSAQCPVPSLRRRAVCCAACWSVYSVSCAEPPSESYKHGLAEPQRSTTARMACQSTRATSLTSPKMLGSRRRPSSSRRGARCPCSRRPPPTARAPRCSPHALNSVDGSGGASHPLHAPNTTGKRHCFQNQSFRRLRWQPPFRPSVTMAADPTEAPSSHLHRPILIQSARPA
jgi:hypothetical protein